MLDTDSSQRGRRCTALLFSLHCGDPYNLPNRLLGFSQFSLSYFLEVDHHADAPLSNADHELAIEGTKTRPDSPRRQKIPPAVESTRPSRPSGRLPGMK